MLFQIKDCHYSSALMWQQWYKKFSNFKQNMLQDGRSSVGLVFMFLIFWNRRKSDCWLKILLWVLIDFLPGCRRLAKVLAKSPQSERSDVLERTGRDPGCDWAVGVHQNHGSSLQKIGSVRIEPSFPGQSCFSLGFKLCQIDLFAYIKYLRKLKHICPLMFWKLPASGVRLIFVRGRAKFSEKYYQV